MKKRIVASVGLSVVLMVFVLFWCKYVEVTLGESEIYSQAELQAAVDASLKVFDEEFEGCTVEAISYDEDFSNQFCSHYKEKYQAENAIILESTFSTDKNGGDGSFAPNEKYEHWMMILTKSANEDWVVRDWGY